MSALVCVDDWEREAKQKLTKQADDYYRSGADEEFTLRRNVTAFNRWLILPRMLCGVSHRSQSLTIYGNEWSMPIAIAPTASQCMAHPLGEISTARAAEALHTVMIISTLSTRSIEDVGLHSPRGSNWFQLYFYKDRSLTLQLVKRAEVTGYECLVVTVDFPVGGKRRDDIRNAYSLPEHLKMANFLSGNQEASGMVAGKMGQSGIGEYAKKLFEPGLTWTDVDWLVSETNLPVVIKGVLTGDDALLAVKHGAQGIIVSNHGARQLDCVPATIECLSSIVDCVGGQCPVFIDGGIRNGTDVFKALALGPRLSLSEDQFCGGQCGVEAILKLLSDELDNAMALAGCKCIAGITRSFVKHENDLYNSKL